MPSLAVVTKRLALLAIDREIDGSRSGNSRVPVSVSSCWPVPFEICRSKRRSRAWSRSRAPCSARLPSWGRSRSSPRSRIGLASAVEDEILIRIVAAPRSRPSAETRLYRQAIPGIEVGIASLRDGVHGPLSSAPVGIMTGHVAAGRLRIAATGHALHDRAMATNGPPV